VRAGKKTVSHAHFIIFCGFLIFGVIWLIANRVWRFLDLSCLRSRSDAWRFTRFVEEYRMLIRRAAIDARECIDRDDIDGAHRALDRILGTKMEP
jgi:hypothetical protein